MPEYLVEMMSPYISKLSNLAELLLTMLQASDVMLELGTELGYSYMMFINGSGSGCDLKLQQIQTWV